MNENDLRQALAGHASTIAPTTELDRMARGMTRVDRMRTARTMGSGCAAAILVTLGVLNFTGGGDATPLDVINQPTPSLPEAEVGLPLLEDPAGNEATTMRPTTSLSASSADTTPDHLTGEGSSPTSTSPAAVVSTTVAPTSTPPTTSPPPAPTTPTTTVPSSSFTASALYGSCAEDPPYDEYSGKATPGATITAVSPYSGSASTVADASGDWWMRVEFPTAPLGQHFDVTVGDGISATTFDFVHTS